MMKIKRLTKLSCLFRVLYGYYLFNPHSKPIRITFIFNLHTKMRPSIPSSFLEIKDHKMVETGFRFIESEFKAHTLNHNVLLLISKLE